MDGKLHYVTIAVELPEPTLEQVRQNRADATGSLECRGTTAKAAPPLGNREWTDDLEYTWRVGTEAKRLGLLERAKTKRRHIREVLAMEAEYGRGDVALPAMRAELARSAEWAEDRAAAMAMAREDIVSVCDERWRSIRCGCSVREMKVACEQPLLCGACRRRHSQVWRKRIVAGMDAALREARREFAATPRYRRRGMTPGIYLITLTGPHSGSFVTDRERMGEAVRELLKHANAQRWWSTYALTWEATKGDDGAGHLHVHLAVISSWIPYRSEDLPSEVAELWCPARPTELADYVRKGERVERHGPLRPGYVRRRVRPRVLLKQSRGLHETWRDAMPGALVLDVKAPGAARDEALSAGVYLAKYVTKGVDAAGFTGRKAGELLVALQGKRKVSTSAGFWVPPPRECPHCMEAWRSVLSPVSMQDIAPHLVLNGRARASGWYQDGKWRRPGSPEDPPWLRRAESSSGRQSSF